MPPPKDEDKLQAAIDKIASAAKTRNPKGFRLMPVSPSPSERSYSSDSDASLGHYNFQNVRSGQMIILLDSARNYDHSEELRAVNM